jgi:hypothetical protein
MQGKMQGKVEEEEKKTINWIRHPCEESVREQRATTILAPLHASTTKDTYKEA